MKDKDFDKFKQIIYNYDDESVNTYYDMCRKCKENREETCCEIYPCELFPEDVIEGQITYNIIIDLLNTNLVCIDSYMDPDGIDKWFLRMKTVGESVRGEFAY